ncbi:hypothetical protein J6590_020942 [Homalodisca vitripennis]|nr:hypothetical protein J6590_020942 [Homalodisca vitripennis]
MFLCCRRLKSELEAVRRQGVGVTVNGRACARCRAELGRIINRGACCRWCRHRVCKSCREYVTNDTSDWLCTVCHKQIEGMVRKWVRMFNGGQTHVHDENLSGRSSLLTSDLRCSRWVQKMLTDMHKTKRLGCALSFAWHSHGTVMMVMKLGSIMSHRNPNSSQNGVATHAISKETKTQDDNKGVLLIDFLSRGETINATISETFRKISNGIMLLHNNACRPISLMTLKHWFNNFAGSSSITCPTGQTWHHGQRFENDDEVKTAMESWLHSLAGTFYEEGIDELITCYDKCLNITTLFSSRIQLCIVGVSMDLQALKVGKNSPSCAAINGTIREFLPISSACRLGTQPRISARFLRPRVHSISIIRDWMNQFVRRPSKRRDNRIAAVETVKRSLQRSWTFSGTFPNEINSQTAYLQCCIILEYWDAVCLDSSNMLRILCAVEGFKPPNRTKIFLLSMQKDLT